MCSLVLAGSARFNLNDMGTAIVASWFLHLCFSMQTMVICQIFIRNIRENYANIITLRGLMIIAIIECIQFIHNDDVIYCDIVNQSYDIWACLSPWGMPSMWPAIGKWFFQWNGVPYFQTKPIHPLDCCYFDTVNLKQNSVFCEFFYLMA